MSSKGLSTRVYSTRRDSLDLRTPMFALGPKSRSSRLLCDGLGRGATFRLRESRGHKLPNWASLQDAAQAQTWRSFLPYSSP